MCDWLRPSIVLRKYWGTMITVYKWDFRSVRCVGHLSMELSDGTYISYWPLQTDERKQVTKSITKPGKCSKLYEAVRKPNPIGVTKSLKKPGRCNRTYEDDVRAEGNKQADVILKIPVQLVSESKVKTWWSNLIGDDKSNKYHLMYKNCATVIKSALAAGGFGGRDISIVNTPAAVIEWIEKVLSEYCLLNFGTYKKVEKIDR
uniref:Uncharacterized protein LOC114326455 n=1 Tax=Diabrotica virgifera virgifera TaxID=50390 RepID=A0A6P7F594_DIAVI